MNLDDRYRIETPEGVPVELTLAGLGSRFLALLLDTTIQVAILFLLAIFFGVENGYLRAFLILAVFLVLFGYHILFETVANGRTPGKAAAGIRVVALDGGPVTFLPSAVRNLLRIVDGCTILTFFLAPVGLIAVFVSDRNQRVGDMAGGTLVVRDRVAVPAPPIVPVVATDAPYLAWDVSGVTADELATIRRFLDRRLSLSPDARQRLGEELASRIRPKVAGAESWPAELVLEGIAAAKYARG
ncbi:MAG: RDD family protein [Acidimicrobiia bacterium]